MKYLTGKQIRQMWIDFFQSKGHGVEAGASLIPNDDPTLLWMNSGVAALKKYFDGSVVPKNPRIVNAQKCIRTNDIENVGKTARHHTFFEMLGNFSIGDYFRKEAIVWGFELLTDPKWFGFDKDLLYVTIYPGDQETKELWKSLGILESHIIPTADSNFWEIGEGPCGPCTEIFVDRGPKFGDFTPDAIRDDTPNDRYIEVWNIVFSQFNAKPGLSRSEYPELPNKNIDTGSGLERFASVLQETDTNFETDLFLPIIKRIESISSVPYTGQMAFKVIADHIRTVSFAVADGAVLSNEGRGYVLRRLLRRAVKYGRKLGINYPFMDQLVDDVVSIMKDFYPYLVEKAPIIKTVISAEETKFLETLSLGEKRFDSMADASLNETISGTDAFLLYDTFGFPIELTVEYAQERGLEVDIEGFKLEMSKQKERARGARKDMQSMKSQNVDFLQFIQPSTFVGYEQTMVETKIIKVFPEGIVLEKTPFYATSGGQIADTGVIFNEQFSIEVFDVTKLPNGQFLHHYQVKEGTVLEGATVLAKIDDQKRKLTTFNHSATHLLFLALRDILGPHVSQQGSLVTPEYLRFDFNHYQPITEAEILKLESTVNDMIQQPFSTETLLLSVEEAIQKGAVAEFGEKYGDVVRVVNLKHTLDLCGGTHVDDLSKINRFAIVSVASIGSGIFRVEGLTNVNVDGIVDSLSGINQDIDNLVQKAKHIQEEAFHQGIKLDFTYKRNEIVLGSYADVIAKRQEVQELQKAVKELEKLYSKQLEVRALSSMDEYIKQIQGNQFIGRIDHLEVGSMKQIVDNLMNVIGQGFVFLASVQDEKVTFIAKSTDASIHAGNIVKQAALLCGGNGGGRNDFAQAGGKLIEQVDQAIALVRGLTK
ncbi:MAG: alanine--tRNA ligase [Candidatus Izemoplasmatales bacterium]|nr:alanine--tRNA ligase [Candidatus Izemoplasmatales bacterium]